MALVGSLVVSLGAQTQDFESGMRRSSRQLQDFRTGTVQAQGTITGLTSTLAELAGGVAVLEGLRRGVLGVIEAGDTLRQTQRVFTLVKESAEDGAAALSLVRGQARQLAQEFRPLQDSYVQLTAASKGTVLQGQLTDRMFLDVTSSTAALGKTAEETQGIFLAFQQMLSKGTISAQDFNQVAERFPGFLGTAARALGVTTQEFVHMRESGQLMISDLAKISHQMAGELGQKGTEGVHSLGRAWGDLKNAMTEAQEAADRFGLSHASTFVLEKTANVVRFLTPRPAPGQIPDEVTHLQQQYPGAKIAGGPEAAELAETGREHQRLTTALSRLPAGSGMYRETAAELERVTYQYGVQLETLKKLGEVSQQQASQALAARPGALSPQALQDAALLQAELQQRISGVTSALAQLDQRQQLGADAADIEKQKIEALNKALTDMQGILARTSSQPLLPFLAGGTLQTPIRQIPLDRWQAQVPGIQRISGLVGVDPALVAAVMAQESAFNPQATSKAGAQGLMQLMPETASAYGIRQPYDPEQSIIGGSMLLRDLQRQFPGDLPRVLASYNFGAGNVARTGMENLPAATRDFLARVQENYAMLRAGVDGLQGGFFGEIQRLRDLRAALQGQPTGSQRDLAEEHLQVVVPESERLPLGYAYGAGRFTPSQAQRDLAAEHAPGLVGPEDRLPLDFAFHFAKERRQALQGSRLPDLVQQLFDQAEEQVRALPGALTEGEAAQQKQALLDQVQGITTITEALAEERDQLLLTKDALLAQSLARQHATKDVMDMALEMQRTNRVLQDASQYAGFVTDSLIEMATSGEVSAARLAQAFGRMTLSMLADAAGVKQALTGLFGKGLEAVGLLSGSGGASFTQTGTTGATLAGAEAIIADAHLAGGGDMTAGRPYLVGEQGPELVVPRGDSTVLPHAVTQRALASLAGDGDGGSPSGHGGQPGDSSGATIMHLHGPLVSVATPDVKSFQRSQGEIEARTRHLMQKLQRLR